MTEHDAVAYLRNAHQRAEELARAAMKPGHFYPPDPIEWVIANNDLSTRETEAAEAHIRLHAPTAVLARVTAERAILAEHEATWPSGEPEYDHHHETAIGEHGRTRYIEVRNDEPNPPYWCACCSAEAPCRTVRLLAAGWGWTEET